MTAESSEAKNKKGCSIDDLISNYDLWKKVYDHKLSENEKLHSELAHLQRDKLLRQEKNEVLAKDILHLKNVIINYQEIFKKLSYINGENASLKEQMCKMEEERSSLIKEHQIAAEVLQQEVDRMKHQHRAEMEASQRSQTEQEAQRRKEWSRILQDRDDELQGLRLELARLQQDRDRQLSQLHHEQETREKKLRDQIAKLKSTGAQDIFRKKLQNEQELHAKEVASLREELNTARSQLARSRHTDRMVLQPLSLEPAAPPRNTKRRKLYNPSSTITSPVNNTTRYT